MSTPAELNHRQLVLRYVLRLAAERPQTVLDVGSGRGLVLEHLKRAGIPAVGLEADPLLTAELTARGHRVVRASADRLPFRARMFDWVGLRHVPHHVPDVERALAEAARVARTGIIIAEPWYDLSLPSQALGLRIERWRKRQHRRRGDYHAENLSPGELIEKLPADVPFGFVVENSLPPRTIDPADLEPVLQRELVGLDRDDPDRDEYREICRRLRADGATYNGTAILVAKRAGV